MKDARLYINNQEIEFSNAPDVLFTFQEDDLTNPTIVKNSYTKTVTIPGTPNNNSIFDGIWNVERIQGDDNFNVTKRVPFSLYVNGDIYQTGYAKLDKISRNNNKIEYSITLYGGLGQFLYNLSIDWNSGDKKTLADMDYFKSSESEEAYDLGFTINKDTVASAWTQINSNDKWGVVNFAPTYLGYPDKISCDKVLINFSGNTMVSGITDGSTAFTPSGGFALGTSPQKLTSEEVRDYRSYIQTPVMRVHSIIDAICRKENNAGRYDEGYEVVLDNEFFNTANPYYWDAWVTLPTITNLEFSSEGGGGTTTAYTANPVSSEWDINGNCLYTFELSETITGGNISVKATIDLGVTGTTTSDVLYFYYTQRYGRGQKAYKRNAYGLQLYASNSVTSSENILAGSNIKWLSGEQRYTYADAVASGQFTPKWNTNVVENHTGYFTRVSGSTFHYTGTSGNLLELRCDLPIGTRYFKLFMKRCNSSNDSERNMLFTSTLANTGDKISVTPLPFNSKTIELSSIDSGESISNKYISKEMLLSTSYSPADWLLSYCKKFGLYIKKDIIDDKIYILTRNNYYKRDNIIDIEKDIDLSKTFDINPVYCQNGYLSLTDEGVESKSESDYTQKTGKIYGQKIVNTGYEFNADTKELNNGIFKNAVQAKDVSQYYYKPNASGLYPYVYNGFKYNLYENGDYSGSTKEYNQPSADIAQTFQPFDENFPNYDLISKPMFSDTDGKSLDTENVLLFFNGYENVSQYNWMLTDDIAYMYKLNNNPTWLLTLVEEDMVGNKIAKKITNFPRFSRWLEGNRWMIYSFDYGSPRLLYVPEMTNNDEGNVYWNYYKKYYEDLYDVDTKVVDCNTLGKFNEESLRYVYWFRNRYWRLNKITDYNPTSYNTTKTQFISLNDINSLTNEVTSRDLWLEVELDKYYLPQSGGTIIGTVRTSDNGPWTIESISISPSGDSAYTVTIDPMGGGSDGNFTVTTNALSSDEEVDVTIVVSAGDISKSVTFTQGDSSFSYTTLKILSGGTIGFRDYFKRTNHPNLVISYSKNGGEWQNLSSYTRNTVTVSPGDVIRLKGENVGYQYNADIWELENYYFLFTDGDVRYNVYGNILSLFYGDDYLNHDTLPEWNRKIPYDEDERGFLPGCLRYFFCNMYTGTFWVRDGVVSARNLHFPTNTNPLCYEYMFAGNRYMTEAPKNLPAKILSERCYCDMFAYCTGLTTTPVLPATTLGNNCCEGMFYSCTTLTTAPELPATTLADGCYNGMFVDCSGLTYSPELPATVMCDNCYRNMFAYCSNLTTPPELSSKSLATGCYQNMFQGCTSLTKAPELPATTLETRCYSGMFSGCTSLTTAPELPATSFINPKYADYDDELMVQCYQDMFAGCTSLTKAPVLPILTVYNGYYAGEYEGMFSGCSNLSYIKCLATEIVEGGTHDWVAGVAPEGTFVKNSSMENWTTGRSGIPNGWVVVDEYSSAVAITNLTWVVNIPASGGTATKENCTYSVKLYDDKGNSTDITNAATISGSMVVPASTVESEHTAGTLTLTVSYMGMSGESSVDIYQNAYTPPTMTGISINNLTWVTDVPALGGTASSANCSFNVVAEYSDSSTVDVTTQSTISGTLTVSASTSTVRHQAGTLVLNASYSGFTASASTDIYQEAYVPSVDYFAIEAVSSGDIVIKGTRNIEYSTDNGSTWVTTAITSGGTTFPVNVGDTIKFRGDNIQAGIRFINGTAMFKAKGNIMSIIDSVYFDTITTLSAQYTFSYMFDGCTGLTDASELELPAKTLSYGCCEYMFRNCTSLTTAPELPATTLARRCYYGMFNGCTSLTFAPSVLPATTLEQYCYCGMFYGCSSLTTAPDMYCDSMAFRSCWEMFRECANLNHIKCLATDISAEGCTFAWVTDIASTGTFIKNQNMYSWQIGAADDSGIPSGWTVVNA